MVRTMTEGIVNRFLSSAKAEVLQKNETKIRCPCRRCKLKSLIADPDSGQVRDHLLLRGFMDGYRWQGDEDDYEVVHGGRARNEEGQQDNHRGSGGREDEESPGDDHDGDAVHSPHVGGKENRVSSGFTAREIPCVHEQLHHLSGRARGVYHMSGVRRHSIQEEEESSLKSGVILSDHSSSAAVFHGP